MAISFVQIDPKGLRLSLHAQPGASKNEFAGIHGDALKLRVAARAENNEANKAVCNFLADFFGVPKTSVSILRGQSARQKTVLILGESAQLLSRLESLKL